MNPAISRKAAMTDQIYIYAKTAKYIGKNQDGFSLRFFNAFGAGGFNPWNDEYGYFTQSRKDSPNLHLHKDRKVPISR